MITATPGRGKSEAIAAFEDGGYFCVDNLPPRMIGQPRRAVPPRGQRRRARRGRLRRARRRVLRATCSRCSSDLEATALKPKSSLFLEADEETRCVDRYKETRRRHPLAPKGQDRRRDPAPSASFARAAAASAARTSVMDTSDLTGGELRRRIAEEMLGSATGRATRRPLTPAHLRLQERAAARRRPHPRRPLPAQSHYVDELRP